MMDIESNGPAKDVHPYVFQRYEYFKTDPHGNVIYRIGQENKFIYFLNEKWRVSNPPRCCGGIGLIFVRPKC